MASSKLSGFLLLALLIPCAAIAKEAKPATPAPKHDNHAPIEVTSDKLEVFQQENRAVFSGHVVAIQGDVRLKSDVMNVFYRRKENPDAPDAKKTASTVASSTAKDTKDTKDKSAVATPDDSSIKKIEATGNVFLSTPEETASGDSGTYEPDDHLIHLNDHVVLTKGKNVLKGDHLVYNLDSGQSKLTGGDADKKPARVHALFVPGDKDSPLKKDAPK